jgi:cytochrome oxidase Cu insertion factor (SCO1/SenC/PrrC family)
VRWIAGTAATVIVIAVVAAIDAARERGTALTSKPDQGVYRGSEPPGRHVLPSFRLPTYGGRTVDSGDLQGRVVVAMFVDTACREACPIIVSAVAAGLRSLDPVTRRRVIAVAFSVDPEVDTPRHVRAFLEARNAAREIVYAVARVGKMRPVWKAFFVLPAVDSGDADTHSAGVRIFDRNGVWVSTLRAGLDLTSSNIAHDIEIALSRSDAS